MEIFVVGGAVRNVLLNRDVNDVDYVVVGSTPEEMLKAGFTQVGADFPVFLYPGTNVEYALARTERKSGVGYHGFDVDIKDVTLEDDLLRRDLTINAMAVKVSDWENFLLDGDRVKYVIDPHGGLRDLEMGLIRPVRLDTFIEDPLRVLRAARFAAVYNMDWTREMRNAANHIFHSAELKNLPAERFGIELEKAISQCSTVGDFCRFLGYLDQVLNSPIETFDYFAGQMIKEQSNKAKSLGSKLRLLNWPEIVEYLRDDFNISNLLVDQIELTRRVHHLPHRLLNNSPVFASALFEAYSAATKSKEGADLDFVRDMLQDYEGGDEVYEWLLKVEGVFESVRFATVNIPENVPKSQYSAFIARARIDAISDLWKNRA